MSSSIGSIKCPHCTKNADVFRHVGEGMVVMCKWCGARGKCCATLDAAVKSFREFSKPKSTPPADQAKFFTALEELGATWKAWSLDVKDLIMKTAEAIDARLLKLEKCEATRTTIGVAAEERKSHCMCGGEHLKHEVTERIVLSKPSVDDRMPDIYTRDYKRTGVTFRVTSNKRSGVTSGIVLSANDVIMNFGLLGYAVTTKLVAGDTFSHKHGARIVLMKMIAEIKSRIIGTLATQLRRMKNKLKNLQVNLGRSSNRPKDIHEKQTALLREEQARMFKKCVLD